MQNSAVDWGLPGRANSVFRLFTSLVPTLAELGRRRLAWGCWIASCLLGPIQGPELGTLESNTKYSFSLHHLSLCVSYHFPKIVRESLDFPLPELNENKGISVELIPPFLFLNFLGISL